jgi:hypothetical protein
MNAKLPPALRARTARESVLEDIEPWVGSTLEQRIKAVDSLSSLAIDMLRANPNVDAAVAWQDPVPPSSREHWARLMRLKRAG